MFEFEFYISLLIIIVLAFSSYCAYLAVILDVAEGRSLRHLSLDNKIE